MTRIVGTIDLPAWGTVLDPEQPVIVAGWAYGGDEPVAFVEGFLDDHPLGRVVPNGSRPDVARALGVAAAARSGFTMTVRLPPVRRVQGQLVVTAVLADGRRDQLGPVRVQFRQTIHGHIDAPDPGSILSRTGFRVRGWAHARPVSVSRIDLFFGGEWLGRAGLGRIRPDVAEALGDPNAELSGFDFDVALPPGALSGPTSLTAVATLIDGRQEEFPEVLVRIEPPPDRLGPPVPAVRSMLPHARVRRPETTRVLWSARGLDQGGSQLRMAELIEALRDRGGFQSTVIAPSDGPLRRRLEAAGATVELSPAVPLDDVTGYDRAVSALGSRIEGCFDVVVGFTVTSFPAVDAAAQRGLPALLRIGEAAPLRTVVGWLFGALDPEVERRARRAVAGASAVVSNSHAAVETYRSAGYEGRFVVLPTGVDIPAESAITDTAVRHDYRRRLGIDPDERLLLYPASVWPIKGQAILVAAFRELHSRCPQLRCALIGHGDAGYARPLAAFIERNGLSRVVRIQPFDDNLGPWWHSADVVVCASESEAMPAAVLEGMAHRLPALACRVGDLPRLIEPGISGWLCDHSDVASMASALEAVAQASPDSLRCMGVAAAGAVARSHDRAQAQNRWIELLR